MANITVKDLTNFNLREDVNLKGFVQDLSEEQISLRGGMCAASDGELSGSCSDVIINFPEKFDLTKLILKRK
jgi:hypothetical protein